MATTPRGYMALVYLHLLAALVVTGASTKTEILPDNNIIALVIAVIVSLALTFLIINMSPGPLKYLVYAVYLLLLGQLFRPLVDKLSDEGELNKVLGLTAGVFLGMTGLAFYDNQNMLGFGPYLLAGLVGLILARIGLSIGGLAGSPLEDLRTGSKILSTIGVILFAVYVAYDTQIIKQQAIMRVSGRRNYINDSMGLYLDVLNLFSSIGDLVSD